MAAKKLFGTSGIRGLVGSEVTCELALNVGKSWLIIWAMKAASYWDMIQEPPIRCWIRQFAQDFWKAELMW